VSGNGVLKKFISQKQENEGQVFMEKKIGQKTQQAPQIAQRKLQGPTKLHLISGLANIA
jgi:hypothetical protein